MRKGRLISKYEFKPLTIDKTNALLEYLYIEKVKESSDNPEGEIDGNAIPVSNKGLTLADIYHFYDDSYETKRKAII